MGNPGKNWHSGTNVDSKNWSKNLSLYLNIFYNCHKRGWKSVDHHLITSEDKSFWKNYSTKNLKIWNCSFRAYRGLNLWAVEADCVFLLWSGLTRHQYSIHLLGIRLLIQSMTLEWAVACLSHWGTIGSNCRLFKSTVLSSCQVEFSNVPWWIGDRKSCLGPFILLLK